MQFIVIKKGALEIRKQMQPFYGSTAEVAPSQNSGNRLDSPSNALSLLRAANHSTNQLAMSDARSIWGRIVTKL
jgi:hypothetical protein